jgi:hypothetical protein
MAFSSSLESLQTAFSFYLHQMTTVSIIYKCFKAACSFLFVNSLFFMNACAFIPWITLLKCHTEALIHPRSNKLTSVWNMNETEVVDVMKWRHVSSSVREIGGVSSPVW